MSIYMNDPTPGNPGDAWIPTRVKDAMEEERRKATDDAAATTNSPEIEEMRRKELAHNEKLIRQAEKRIQTQKALEAATKRTEKAEEEARKGNAREMRLLAKEAGI